MTLKDIQRYYMALTIDQQGVRADLYTFSNLITKISRGSKLYLPWTSEDVGVCLDELSTPITEKDFQRYNMTLNKDHRGCKGILK